ncbi:MAG: sigma 54-interacting transcriptional regulator [Lacipirellulaceae bacterium]
MSLLSSSDQQFLTVLAELSYCNPFEPRRLELEQAALGEDYQPEQYLAWSRKAITNETARPNVVRLTEKADRLAVRLREALSSSGKMKATERQLYEDLIVYVLYYRWFAGNDPVATCSNKTSLGKLWRSFRQELDEFRGPKQLGLFAETTPEHLFACLHQVRRAFKYIFDCIYGDSLPAARLRGTVWQSIFTHDMRRYRRTLYKTMSDYSTLITGPSGTGKELVARAIALSQYVAFDPKQECFVGQLQEGFIPINLSALSPTLIESELFGHCRGAFTGATADRSGWLETCPSHGAVFLDEIGELDLAIQVKLLRVVQSRCYSRLGDTKERTFAGKIIAATNRNLAERMSEGYFRADLYYRLCSDHIQTPSLREQLSAHPEALTSLVKIITERVAGCETAELAAEVESWISREIPADYPWPGNIRELEQCVRNVLIRKQYVPWQPPADKVSELPAWLEGVPESNVTADELLRRYCTATYARLGSYEQTAKALGLDRRTVKAKIDVELLESLR